MKTIYWVLGVIVVIIALSLYANDREKWEREWKEANCELTFYKYTYEIGCAGTCSVKCSDEGFPHTDYGVFYPYLSAEDMNDESLYKQCECNCGGCRGK